MLKRIFQYTGTHRISLLIALLFALIYSAVVFFNHYCFRTYALDLGVYTNAIFDYSHFRLNDSGVFKETYSNLLSDHFDLSLILLSPFSWIFGQYTLLILQIVFVIAGGAGVYHLVLDKTASKFNALMAQLHLLLFFSVFSALSFDYHSNVLAAMLLPWFMLMLFREKFKFAFLFFLLMLLCKESTALLHLSVCAGLLFEFRKSKKHLIWLSFFIGFSIVYFVMTVSVIMPLLSPEAKYSHYKYHILGNNYSEAFRFVIQNPLETIRILFINHSAQVQYDWVKTEFYLFISLSGLVLLLFRPWFLLMLIVPIIGKMCYDQPSVWSIDAHYSIEFAPLICIGSAFVLQGIKNIKRMKIAMLVLLISTLGITIRLMDYTVYKRDYMRLRIYQAGHYKRIYDVSKVHDVIKKIPEDAIVSAQSAILPHLAYRDKAYMLPIVKDAEYMVASYAEQGHYPLDSAGLHKQINDSLNSGSWKILNMSSEVIVLKRRRTGE